MFKNFCILALTKQILKTEIMALVEVKNALKEGNYKRSLIKIYFGNGSIYPEHVALHNNDKGKVLRVTLIYNVDLEIKDIVEINKRAKDIHLLSGKILHQYEGGTAIKFNVGW